MTIADVVVGLTNMATLNNILLNNILRSESKDVAKMAELRQKTTAGYWCYSNATWVISEVTTIRHNE